MKYFTPEHYIRIKSAFPKEVRRFDEEQICLHDAELLQMGHTGEQFVMVLQMELPSRILVILTFTLSGVPEVDTEILPENLRGPVPY